jgi:putative ABC transport system permease protein
MLRNYLTVAARNIIRHRLYAFINVVGLAVGLGCCTLVILFVQREFNINQYHAKGDRLYRVLRQSGGDEFESTPGTSGALGPALVDEFPGVEATVRQWGMRVWALADEKVFEQNVAVVDPDYFEVFSFDLLAGDPKRALREPNGIVIDESMAKRYFGDADPLGQTVVLEDLHFAATLKVTGVMRDRGDRDSWHFWLDAMTSTLETQLGNGYWHRWVPHGTWRPIHTYVLLRADADPEAIREQLPAFLQRHLGEDVAKLESYKLQSIERMYLDGNLGQSVGWASRRIRSYIGIAFGVLLIACINFMNLATARSMLRAHEVGLRKTIGATRLQLATQFLSESLLLACFAFLLGLGLARLLLPTFESLIGDLVLDSTVISLAAPYLFLATVLTGIIAGSYPALFLSRLQPLETLRGEVSSGRSSTTRKALVVIQFAVAISLLIGTLTVQDQIEYVTNRPLGFDRDHVVILPLYELDRQVKPNAGDRIAFQNATIKPAFLAHPDVLKVSAGRSTPGTYPGMRRKWRPDDRPEELFDIFVQEGDDEYIDFFGLNLLAGRSFDGSLRDTASVIINQSAAERLKWDDPVGHQVEWVGAGIPRWLTIVGVIEDYQNQSLRKGIAPGAVIQFPRLYFSIYLKVRPGSLPDILPDLESTWKTFLPDRPFRYTTLDEELSWHYWDEEQFRQIMRIFCGFAMLLACLGLYGLAAFTAERRTKEIGIRKVLGASVNGLLGLMAREFAVLVGIANLVAWPLAYVYLNDWLGGYVQRIDLTIVPFLLGAALVLLIAMVTISLRTYAATQTDPVDAIRSE